MSANTIIVKNLAPEVSEKEIRDFFSFCGKITSLEVKSEPSKEASVTFEKQTAAKTALLLDNTKLGSSQVSVTSASGSDEDDGSHFTSNAERDSDEITQEEKPRSRIAAEYLAHGYVLGDQALQRAIDLDNKHGISSRFLNTLQQLDTKYHATDKAKSVDESYGVTAKANSLLSGLTSYYEKAAGTPTGKKLVDFYTQSSRQVQDIHTEARRLADIKKGETGEKQTCKCGNSSDKCTCEPGTCNCGQQTKEQTAQDKHTVTTVSGKNNVTKCSCGGNSDICACESGKCGCSDCPKSDVKAVPGTTKTSCGCGGTSKECPCEAGKCACSGCAH